MKSVKELRESIDEILIADGVAREKIMEWARRDHRYSGINLAQDALKIAEKELEEITQKHYAMFLVVLSELAQHESPEAVKVIKRVFRSKIVPYRLLAIRTLSAMSIPEAAKALARRTYLWSFAKKEEKDLAKSLLRVRS